MLLVPLRLLLVMALLDPVGLIVCPLLLPFLIHEEDPFLPFLVCSWYVNTDIGDDGGVSWWNAPAYRTDQESLFRLVICSSHKFGFSFQGSEEDCRWPIPHLDFTHFDLVHLLGGRVLELFMKDLAELLSARVAITQPCHLVFDGGVEPQDIPIVFSEVDPPILGIAFQVGGGEDDHE